jgi:hypothetical protein
MRAGSWIKRPKAPEKTVSMYEEEQPEIIEYG